MEQESGQVEKLKLGCPRVQKFENFRFELESRSDVLSVQKVRSRFF